MDNNLLAAVFLWFTEHPFGVATILYVTSVCSVLGYTYFESRELV
jgi:hypothetical protein